MANRTDYQVVHRKTEVELVTADLQGAGAAALAINDAAQAGGSEVSAIARTGVGAHTITMRRTWPKLLDVEFICGGATAGLRGRVTARPVPTTAGWQVTVQFEVAGVATEAAAGDFISMRCLVRNSGRN